MTHKHIFISFSQNEYLLSILSKFLTWNTVINIKWNFIMGKVICIFLNFYYSTSVQVEDSVSSFRIEVISFE